MTYKNVIMTHISCEYYRNVVSGIYMKHYQQLWPKILLLSVSFLGFTNLYNTILFNIHDTL